MSCLHGTPEPDSNHVARARDTIPTMDPIETVSTWRRITSPMGAFLLGLRADGSLVTDWPDWMDRPWPVESSHDPHCLAELADVLQRYFAGEPVDPATADFDIPGGPPFYRSCWEACRRHRGGQQPGPTSSLALLAVGRGACGPG